MQMMKPAPISADAVKADLLAHCEEIAAVAIEGLSIDLGKGAVVRLGLNDFFAASAAEKPRAIFWYENVFDVEDWIEDELREAGWDEDKVGDEDAYWPSLDQAHKYLCPRLETVREYSGSPYFVMALYTTDGVCRVTSFLAAWYSGLSTAIEEMLEERMEAARLEHSRGDTKNKALLNQLIDEIAARDDFRAAKGLPKRALLIQTLYGDKIPKHPKGLTTRLKQHLDDMDVNMAYVLKAADEKAWLDKALKK